MRRRIGRYARCLAAHLLTASATASTENAENVRRLDLHLEHGANEYCAGSESEPSEHHSPVPQPHRVDSARILPLIRLQEQRLLLLTEALNEGGRNRRNLPSASPIF